jgi:hypothetical protein
MACCGIARHGLLWDCPPWPAEHALTTSVLWAQGGTPPDLLWDPSERLPGDPAPDETDEAGGRGAEDELEPLPPPPQLALGRQRRPQSALPAALEALEAMEALKALGASEAWKL